jgi:hypothetical protein
MYVAGLVAAFPDLAFAVKRISVDGDRQPEGTASVVGFFNQKTFVEQLGLQALIVFEKVSRPCLSACQCVPTLATPQNPVLSP